MRSNTLAILALLGACSGRDVSVASELGELRDSLAQHSRAIDQVSARVDRLARTANEAARTYERAAEAFDEASRRFAAAHDSRLEQHHVLAEATARFEEATERWIWAQQLIVAAAILDASQMDRAVRGSAEPISCDGGMSPAAFRSWLVSIGVSVAGMHVDHIVPRALGGADHPSNYQLLPSRLNQSFGARFDAEKCAVAGAGRCRAAVAVSRKCGAFQGHVPKS